MSFTSKVNEVDEKHRPAADKQRFLHINKHNQEENNQTLLRGWDDFSQKDTNQIQKRWDFVWNGDKDKIEQFENHFPSLFDGFQQRRRDIYFHLTGDRIEINKNTEGDVCYVFD